MDWIYGQKPAMISFKLHIQAVPAVLYRQIEFLQVFLDRNQVYADNRTLHTPFRLVPTTDLHPEFDSFHFLELDQIQLLNDSIDRNKRTTVGHRRTIVKSSPEYQ